MLAEDLRANSGAGLLTLAMITTLRLGQMSRKARGIAAVLAWPLWLLTAVAYRLLSGICNCSVPFSVCIGRRVRWQHGFNGIFVARDASIGDDCIILHQVTIGSNLRWMPEDRGSPVIGNGVLIGAGAKIIGGVIVGDGARIGAQALVTNDVPEQATCVAPSARILAKSRPQA
jgi:serine O-acetyltransferase